MTKKVEAKKVEAKADPTNKKILQLEAENIALKDDRTRYKQAYEAAQRDNSVFVALADEARQLIKPIKPLAGCPKFKLVEKKITETLCLHLTDEHADELVLPHQVGNLERVTFPIMLRRAETYVDTVIKFALQTLSNYDFHEVYILAHGDHTSGEIHKSVDHSYYRNMFDNCYGIGQMHALMYRDLAAYFPQIHVVYVPGNHGRRSIKKDYNNPTDNWDYLVARIAESYCQDLKNVDFLIPDSFSVNLDIEGHGFHVAHGDDIKSWSGIPWYGIERKTRRLTALNSSMDKRIDYYCFGHFHNIATQSALNGETLLNGTWVATTPYVYNSLSSYSEPSQLVHGVHKDHGISWRLNVKLRSDREHLGPKRYGTILKDRKY
jgi:hypothetical protein